MEDLSVWVLIVAFVMIVCSIWPAAEFMIGVYVQLGRSRRQKFFDLLAVIGVFFAMCLVLAAHDPPSVADLDDARNIGHDEEDSLGYWLLGNPYDFDIVRQHNALKEVDNPQLFIIGYLVALLVLFGMLAVDFIGGQSLHWLQVVLGTLLVVGIAVDILIEFLTGGGSGRGGSGEQPPTNH